MPKKTAATTKQQAKGRKKSLSDNLAYLLIELTKAYRSHIDRKMAKFDLDRSQWPLLVNLWYMDGATQQELADFRDMSRGGMNKLIDRLEEAGFVRRADGADRRSKRIFLVDEVRPLVAEIDRAQREMVKASLSVLTASEAAMLKQLLRKVGDGIASLD